MEIPSGHVLHFRTAGTASWKYQLLRLFQPAFFLNFTSVCQKRWNGAFLNFKQIISSDKAIRQWKTDCFVWFKPMVQAEIRHFTSQHTLNTKDWVFSSLHAPNRSFRTADMVPIFFFSKHTLETVSRRSGRKVSRSSVSVFRLRLCTKSRGYRGRPEARPLNSFDKRFDFVFRCFGNPRMIEKYLC